MAIRITCDCGCAKELGEHDVGRAPMMLRHNGVIVEVRAYPAGGKPMVNLRPSCLREMLAKATQVFPPVVQAADPGLRDDHGDPETPAGAVP